MTEKETILKAMSEMPDDANIQDAMERLYLLYKVEQGLEQSKARETISQAEARKRLAKWLP